MKQVSDLLRIVASVCRVSEAKILERGRTKEVAEARQIFAYLLRELNHFSFPQIGREVGGRDHTTALHAYGKIADQLNRKARLREKLDLIIKSLPADYFVIDDRPLRDAESRKLDTGAIETIEENSFYAKPEFETSEDILSSSMELTITSREKEILTQYRQGLTLDQIAANIGGVTRERIRQLVMKTLVKELGEKARDGYNINIKEYIDSEKQAHNIAKHRVPENIRQQLLAEVPLFEAKRVSIRDLANKYKLPAYKIETFPEIARVLEERKREKANRWSWYYTKCRKCGTVTVPHLRKGLCERCAGSFRTDKYRNKAVAELGERCGKCGMGRKEAIRQFGRDLYLSRSLNSDRSLVPLCRGCFLTVMGRKLAQSRRSRSRLRQ